MDVGPPKLSEALADKSKKVFTQIWSYFFAQNRGWIKGKGDKNLVQNLTRQPQLFRAPLDPGPGTMYPLNPPLAGPAYRYSNHVNRNRFFVFSIFCLS